MALAVGFMPVSLLLLLLLLTSFAAFLLGFGFLRRFSFGHVLRRRFGGYRLR